MFVVGILCVCVFLPRRAGTLNAYVFGIYALVMNSNVIKPRINYKLLLIEKLEESEWKKNKRLALGNVMDMVNMSKANV